MATPAKKRTSPKVQGIPPALRAKALEILKDPRVHQLIIENSGAIIDRVRQWAASIGDKFGQKGLERRAANARSAVVDLSSTSTELARALQPVAASLDEVDRMLHVSAVLPLAKRKQAHRKIDDVLDELESGLFDATLPGDQPNPKE